MSILMLLVGIVGKTLGKQIHKSFSNQQGNDKYKGNTSLLEPV